MILIIQTMILAITGAVHMTSQVNFILLILNKKIYIKKFLICAAILGINDQISRSLPGQNVMLNLIIYILVMLLCLKFILRLKVTESILGICLVLILTIIVQYFMASIVTALKLDKLISNNAFQSQFIILNIATILIYAANLIIYYLKLTILIPENTKRSRIVVISTNALVTVIIIIPNILLMENSHYSHYNLPVAIIIFNLISVIILFILGIFNTVRRGELEVRRQQVELQKLYISNLEEITNGLRGFKHDFNNIVQVMGGYIALNDMEGLKNYCKQMQKDCMTVNNRIPLNSFVESNPAIYGLLLSKFTYSEVKNVSFQINAMTDIKLPKNGIYDFCKIIGILLDNAIEAAVQSERRSVEIFIKELNKAEILIDIRNSFYGTIDIEKIFENGYSTKEGHSGFGLWEIKKLLSKYQGSSLDTGVSGGIFTQRLKIRS